MIFLLGIWAVERMDGEGVSRRESIGLSGPTRPTVESSDASSEGRVRVMG